MNISLRPNIMSKEDLDKVLSKTAAPLVDQSILQEIQHGQVGIHLGQTLSQQIADAVQQNDKLEIRHCVGMVRDSVNLLMDFQRRLQILSE